MGAPQKLKGLETYFFLLYLGLAVASVSFRAGNPKWIPTAVSNGFLFSVSEANLVLLQLSEFLNIKGFGLREPQTVNGGKVLVKKKRGE